MPYLANRVALLTWLILLTSLALAQKTSPNSATSVCTFADGNQISVQYNPEPVNDRGFRAGEVWTPGGSPMILFTQTALSAGNSEIPIGAYSIYVIPNKPQWTLIVNKNVSAGSKYDPVQDILRTTMQSGDLSEPAKVVQVVFAHIAPKECNMRIYRAKKGVWASFMEK
jgi:hypothetical protein